MKNSNKKKYLKVILICLVISIFLEIFVFNFRYFISLNYKHTDLTNKVTYHNMQVKKDKIKVNENGYIEIQNINKIAKNIKLNFNDISGNGYLNYTISVTDEANKNYYSLPSRYLYSAIKKSQYINLDLNGKVKNLKINFENDNIPATFKMEGISLNEKVPLNIFYTRVLLVFVSLIIIYIIRPKSEFYKIKIDFNNKNHIIIILCTFAIIALIFLYIVNINPRLKAPPSNHNQYQDLAEAFSQGQVSLLEKPSKFLNNMDNPYDYYERVQLARTNDSFYLWDRAYYKGNYYVYFGVVPVVLTYLPYYLITGTHIANYILGYLIVVLITIGAALLLKEITKRYFKDIPLLLYLILFVFISFSSILILQYPSIYTIPVAYSLMFTYFGLYFMISAIKEKKLSAIRLLLGSLCLALVAGCRPQFLIGSFLLIPLFWKSIFKDRTLFSKKSFKQTLAFILPYIVIAALLMSYNYIRFDSVFDFGSTYNLTNNDLTRRGFKLDRIGFGLFTTMFQPPIIKATFPFMEKVLTVNNYMGPTIKEAYYGGLLVTNIVLWLGIFFAKFKKYLPKVIYQICFISIVGGFLIAIFDIEAGGIIQRYALDYSWLFIWPTAFVIMSIFNSKLDRKFKRYFLIFILLAIASNFLYQGLDLFNDKMSSNMLTANPNFYFKWYYLLQWWL